MHGVARGDRDGNDGALQWGDDGDRAVRSQKRSDGVRLRARDRRFQGDNLQLASIA